MLVTKDGAVRVEVRAKPRAHKSRVVGVRDGALEVALAAPPVDGAANEALVETLAKACGVAKSAVTLVRGASGRSKLLAVTGLTEADVRARLGAAIAR
jgi:uncharacterized protein (TIGR00251 family)